MDSSHDPAPAPAAASPWGRLLDDTSACATGAVPAYDGPPGPHLGALVVPDTLLPAALGAREHGPAVPPLAVRLTGGAGQVAGPAALCARAGVVPARLEVGLRDPVDLAGNARRVVAAVDAARDAEVLPAAVVVAVGLPDEGFDRPGPGWLAAADEAAGAELALALPTAGAAPAAVAAWLEAALDRELAVVATGPHTAAEAVALLLATRLTLDGADHDEVGTLLADAGTAGSDRLRRAAAELGDDALLRARRWLLGVGCTTPTPLCL